MSSPPFSHITLVAVASFISSLLYLYVHSLPNHATVTLLDYDNTFESRWRQQGDEIRAWLHTGRHNVTVRKHSKNFHYWVTFLSDKDLHGFVDLSPRGIDNLRRIIIWFLYYCAVELKLTESQIKSAIQAVQYAFKVDGRSLDVFKDEAVTLARDAIREDPRLANIRRSKKRRLPVTFDMLLYLESVLLDSPHLDDWMTFVGVLTAFHFMLRVSEYTFSAASPHALRAGDVLFLNLSGEAISPWDPTLSQNDTSQFSGAIIDLRSSKADKKGKGRHLYVSRNGPAESHLLDLLIFWSTVAAFTGPTDIFMSHAGRRCRRKHLTSRMIAAALKLAAKNFGFDGVFFSTHSLRIGGMSCGTAAQIPNSTLCRIGGWHGDSEALYRSNVPDRGILSALDAHLLDTKVTLLSSAEVRIMLPTASQFS
jgi:hypothetical protein